MNEPTRTPNGRWRVWVATAPGRGAPRITRTFDRKGEARAWATAMRAQVQQGTWATVTGGEITLDAFVTLWLGAPRRLAPGTVESYEYAWKRLQPSLGECRLDQLRRPQLEQALANIPGAESTRAHTHAVLAMILKAAVVDGRLRTSPLEGARQVTPARKEVPVLTAEQLRRLLLAVKPAYRPMLVTAVGTGLRQAELFGVRRARIDFLRRTLAVEEQIICGKGRPPALTSTLKTPSARRRLPLPTAVVNVLAHELEVDPDRDVMFLTSRSGSLWRRSHFNAQVWKPALRAAGLDVTLGLHVLRHTYASHMIAAGLHPRVIMARMGHASIVETMNTYGHLFPDGDEATREALDGLFGEIGRTPGAHARNDQAR